MVEKSPKKLEYSLTKMLISLENITKTLNTRDFLPKFIYLEPLYAEYTKNLGHSMRFFQKIGKIAIFSIELT